MSKNSYASVTQLKKMNTSLLDTRLLLQLVLYVSKGMLGLVRPGLSTLYDLSSQLNLISNLHVERKVELSSIVRSLAPLKNLKNPDHRANEATWKGQLIPYFTPVRSYDIIKGLYELRNLLVPIEPRNL